MSSIIFHWSVHSSLDNAHAQKKLLARWNLTCKAFGITDKCVSDNPDVDITDAEITFTRFDTLSDALSSCTNELVFIELGGENINTFTHPTDATYIFGADYGGMGLDMPVDATPLTINTNNLPLHSEIACGIVLSHRFDNI